MQEVLAEFGVSVSEFIGRHLGELGVLGAALFAAYWVHRSYPTKTRKHRGKTMARKSRIDREIKIKDLVNTRVILGIEELWFKGLITLSERNYWYNKYASMNQAPDLFVKGKLRVLKAQLLHKHAKKMKALEKAAERKAQSEEKPADTKEKPPLKLVKAA